MMRHLLGLLLVTFAGSAVAEPVKETKANLGGSIDPVCLFSGLTGTGSSGTNILVLPNGAAVEFRRFVDPETALPLPISLNLQFVSTCNFSHRLSLTSRDGGITRQGSIVATSGFSTARNYTADFAWAGNRSQFTTTGVAGEGVGFNVLGATSGGFELSLSAPASNTPLLAGSYADVLTIQISSLP